MGAAQGRWSQTVQGTGLFLPCSHADSRCPGKGRPSLTTGCPAWQNEPAAGTVDWDGESRQPDTGLELGSACVSKATVRMLTGWGSPWSRQPRALPGAPPSPGTSVPGTRPSPLTRAGRRSLCVSHTCPQCRRTLETRGAQTNRPSPTQGPARRLTATQPSVTGACGGAENGPALSERAGEATWTEPRRERCVVTPLAEDGEGPGAPSPPCTTREGAAGAGLPGAQASHAGGCEKPPQPQQNRLPQAGAAGHQSSCLPGDPKPG